ncbi:MAG: LysR family transcriptional regulator [Burkholderiaceae bacterium]
MANPRTVLTPDALAMLQSIAVSGSFAAAARALDLVPSALTYRVRQIEDALDVLLFDRSSRQARLTPAGSELLREGGRLLDEVDAIANRVKRVATGWEAQLTISVDSIMSQPVMMELCQAFLELAPPTRLRLRHETMQGTLQALTFGQADLAIGVIEPPTQVDIQARLIGEVHFVFAVAPHHPLASMAEPLTDAMLRQHRAVAVADSVQRGNGLTVGLLGGQDVFTVASMQAKLDAQLRGIGAGFVPEPMACVFVESGRLVVKQTERAQRMVRQHYAWRHTPRKDQGRALQWWLQQLDSPVTRNALLTRHQHG